MYARYAHWKSQCRLDCFNRVTLDEVVIKFLQALPVRLDVGVFRLGLAAPGSVGNWTLNNYSHVLLHGKLNGRFNGLLVGDTARRLQCIKNTCVDGIFGIAPVAAITDVAGLSSLFGR